MTKIKNKEDFKKVFDEYYLPLCHFLRSYTHDKTLVEDVVQDVFVKLWDKREGIEIKNIKAYLFAAVKNVFLDYKQKENNYKKYVNEQGLKNEMEQPEVEKKKSDLLIKQKIYNSLRHLSPKTREIFELSKLNGLTYVEIAERNNISVKTVEANITKAYKIIKDNWTY